jgi:hypothetical protein
MIRMNHMEITVAPGTIARDGDNLAAFLHDVLGFERSIFPGMEIPYLVVKTDEEASQFLFIAENERPLPPASEDHLGFQLEDIDAVEAALTRTQEWQRRDPRVEIRDMGVLDLEETLTRAIYIRYLLPIWFDVQHIAAKPGFEPAREWCFAQRAPT